MVTFFLGLLIGFLMGIPVGPINIWVINTKISDGTKAAAVLASAGALMDFVYIFFIMSGLSFLHFSPRFIYFANAFGVLALILLGVRELKAQKRPIKNDYRGQIKKNLLKKKFVVGLFIYISNPTLIVTLTALCAFLKSLDFFPVNPLNSFVLAVGVGLGVFFWFLSLILLINKFEKRFTDAILQKINMACAFIIIFFGVYLGTKLIFTG